MVNRSYYHYQTPIGGVITFHILKWHDSVLKCYSYDLMYPYYLRNMLIINKGKNYANVYAWECNVVIIAYRVCQLCASYSARINLAMFNFREIYMKTHRKMRYIHLKMQIFVM